MMSDAVNEAPREDDALGMRWWNGLTPRERVRIMVQAESASEAGAAAGVSAAEAWRMWKAGSIRMDA